MAIPNLAPSLRKTILDAALELADQLVTVQVEFVRSVVRSATGTAEAGRRKASR